MKLFGSGKWRRCSSLLILVSFGVWPVFGATITVTNTNDSGSGSMRDAIAIASPGDTINFSVTGTINYASPFYINKSLTISGPGAGNLALNGNNVNASQALVIGDSAAVTVAISGITVVNSNTVNPPNVLGYGGAILNYGTTNLSNIVVTGCLGTQGGILNVSGGTLTLINSTLSGNAAVYYGGGLENSAGTVTIINSTISKNFAYVMGGGLTNFSGTMTVINSTIAGNQSGNCAGCAPVAQAMGGGLMNDGLGVLNITNSTVSGNIAPRGASLFTYSNLVTLKNTIFANVNSGVAGVAAVNCYGPATNPIAGTSNPNSLGHNLSDDASCFLAGPGDLNNVPAGLDPGGLQNNVGTTQTIALLPGSPAIDKVPSSDCTVATDQRGISRPQGPACDMGSFEVVEAAPYKVCLLYDPAKAVNSGATDPIKLQLCDGSGNDLSSSATAVHATGITQVSTSISGGVQSSGNANPNNDFRFDSTLGSTGGYIFNLSTKGLAAGAYNLNFTVKGVSYSGYAAPFQVK